MSISSSVRKAGPFAGNDVQTVFAFAFKVFATSDVVATQALDNVETVLTLGADYSVSLNADQDSAPGGDVTLSTALPTGETLVLTSNVDALQAVTVTNGGGFFPSVFNGVFDKLTILIQQILEKIDRTFKLQVTATGVTNFNVPVLAGGVLQWAPDGTQLLAQSLPDLASYLALPDPLGNADKALVTDGVNSAWTMPRLLAAFVGLGGLTAAFPAWKRNGTQLQARLGDDSAYTGVRVDQVQFGNGTKFYDTADGVLAVFNNAGTDFTRLCLGGITNLFPAIKRNGAQIDFRLADASGYAGVAGLSFAFGATGRSLSDTALAADLFLGTSTVKAGTPKAIADAQAFGALTDAATIAWAVDTIGNAASVTLTATGHTVGSPTIASGALYDGCPVLLELVQDATGGRAVVWHAVWDFGSLGTPSINSTALKATWVQGVYRSRSAKIHVNKVWQQA